MFSIVSFVEDESTGEEAVAVVPTTWFDRVTGLCYWPPSTNSPFVLEKAVKQSKVPQNGWPQYSARVLRSFQTYTEARQKIGKAAYTSDLSDVDQLPNKRQHKRRPPKSDSDSDEEASENRNHKSKKNSKALLPPPPKYCMNLTGASNNLSPNKQYVTTQFENLHSSEFSQNEEHVLLIDQNEVENNCFSGPWATDLQEKLSSIQTIVRSNELCPFNPQNDVFSVAAQTPVSSKSRKELFPSTQPRLELVTPSSSSSQNSFTTKFVGSNLPSPSFPLSANPVDNNTPQQEIMKMNDAQFKNYVVSNVTIIRSTMQQILDTLTAIALNQRESRTNQDVLPPGLPALNTVAELEQLNENVIQDQKVYNNLVQRLQRFGGKSYQDCTCIVMNKLLTDELASKFNWKSQRGSKLAFCTLALKSVVVEAVQNNHVSRETSDAEIEQIIKTWLKNAPQRLKTSQKPQ